jgi:hypothetical protein
MCYTPGWLIPKALVVFVPINKAANGWFFLDSCNIIRYNDYLRFAHCILFKTVAFFCPIPAEFRFQES